MQIAELDFRKLEVTHEIIILNSNRSNHDEGGMKSIK
jgi:hypothetical protein